MATPKKIPGPPENPYYPLPADYEGLTEAGRTQARVNACSQWMLRYATKQEKIDAYLASIKFFDQWYLRPDWEVNFQPMFYDTLALPDGPAHDAILSTWASARKTACVAPRGIGKSRLNCKDMMMRMLTWDGYSFIYSTSTDDVMRDTGELMLVQFRENERLIHDFAIDGRILRPRGAGSSSISRMRLTNNSRFRGTSMGSRQRGGRPMRYRLDDPEYDPSGSTSMQDLRETLEHTLFHVIIPMVTQFQTGVDWIGTFVSTRHYLWHVMQVQERPDSTTTAEDPRFNLWRRVIIPAAWEDDGKLVSAWPEMWPATKQERIELAKTNNRFEDQLSLEELRMEIGPRVFDAEMMARPGHSSESYFDMDWDPKGSNAWWLSDVDPMMENDPWRSGTRIHWVNDEGLVESHRLVDLIKEGRLFMTGDTSHTATATSDYKACGVFLLAPKNTLFMLDMFAARCDESKLVNETFRLASKWRVGTVHLEAIRQGSSYFTTMEHLVKTKTNEVAGSTHLPKVYKLKIGTNMPKEDKIKTLAFRFTHGKIKLPLFQRMAWPWRMLFNQIDEFNPDVRDGGLSHDDGLDIVSMSQFVVQGRIGARPRPQGPPKDNPVARLMNGEKYDEHGTPLIYSVNLQKLSTQAVNEILAVHDQAEEEEKSVV